MYLKGKKLWCHYYLRPMILERASIEYLAKTRTLSWKLTNFNFFSEVLTAIRKKILEVADHPNHDKGHEV